MQAEQLQSWRARLGLSYRRAADRIGISPRMYVYYEQGDYTIPRTVELACRAVEQSGDR